MKKNVLYYALMASMLVGCSKGGGEGDDTNEGRVPIVLAMGVPPEVDVRGTGAVGGTDGKWSGQGLRIMAFRKGQISNEAADVVGIGSTGIMATTNTNEMTSGLTWAGSTILYYPIQNAYDFYGYYLDDIADNAVITPDVEGTPGKITVPVMIDGTQDLMVAKAELTDAQKAMLDAASVLITDEEKETEYAKAFSSYTARRGVQPSMVFKHLLSRLTFEVKAGDNEALGAGTDGVYITSIELIDVENQGSIVISATEQKLEITPLNLDNSVNLSLKIVNPVTVGGVTFNGYKPTGLANADFVRMGESIMPMPVVDRKQFKAIIKMRQIKNGQLISVDGNNEFPFETVIKAPIVKDKDTNEIVSESFVAGYSYRVKLTMYGLKPVDITAELAPWKQGEDIELTPGDE